MPNVRFDSVTSNSARARWDKPSNGGRELTGFGLLFWRKGTSQPPYSSAFVAGKASRSHTYTGLQAGVTYRFRIHACNGPDSCGWWTHPPKEVTTRDAPTPEPTPTPTPTATARPPTASPVGPPGQVQSLRTSNRTATSFTVHWSPHRNTGGRPLTGFGLLRREQPKGWPSHDQATVVGAASRSHTFTRLKYGRGQGVQIRACNGPNSCGAWSAEVTVTPLPGPLPTLALPKTTLAIGERMSIGANDVPRGATAYIRLEGHIQPAGRCGAARAAGVPRAPSPSTGPGYYDSAWIDGCAPGGDAVVRLESQDGSVLYDRRELKVTSQRPGQVARPVVSARNAALQVDWEAPTDGGTPTHYDVGYRAGTTGAWTETEVRGRTSTTISELENGTRYQVRVRATNTTGDGDWSEIVTGTPQVEAPIVEPGPEPGPTSVSSCGSLVPGALAAPRDLDVIPQSQQRALLTWIGTNAASHYDVRISEVSRTAGNSATYRTTNPCYVIYLDRIIVANPTRGFHHSRAFQLQVEASDGNMTRSSETITIIDTPITVANGNSTGSNSAELRWTSVKDILNNNNYSAGAYDLRYRPASGNHAQLDWQPEDLVSVHSPRRNVASPLTLTGLVPRQVYAIQLIYREGSSTSYDTDVFAARYSYVWPSSSPAASSESSAPQWVAGMPLRFPLPSTTYEYRICKDTFPVGKQGDWSAFIQHAFEQWELATGGVVTMTYNSEDCTDYSNVVDEVLEEVRSRTGLPDTSFRNAVVAILSRLRWTDIRPNQIDDSRLNEIIMLDDIDWGADLSRVSDYDRRREFAFSEFADSLGFGLRDCWGGYGSKNQSTIACAIPTKRVGFEGYTTDIFLRRTKVEHDPLALPGGDANVDPGDISFNKCPAVSKFSVYGVLVHEVGHALGIRSQHGDYSAHPAFRDTVMTAGITDFNCSPHPLDVLAMRALYQSR